MINCRNLGSNALTRYRIAIGSLQSDVLEIRRQSIKPGQHIGNGAKVAHRSSDSGDVERSFCLFS